MNKSAIDWCDYTWNPVTGCRHDCEYCYARKMTRRFSGEVRLNKMAKADYETEPAADGKGGEIYILDKPMLNEKGNPIVYPFGFEPTFHRYRMDWLDKLKNGQNIFVGAMADLFGEWVPEDWIDEIFEKCQEYPQHNYIFLTKNPERFINIRVPEGDNYWYGCTATGNETIDNVGYLPADRKIFVSIEPILEEINVKWASYLSLVNWVIIGAETGNRKEKVVPRKEWIIEIEAYCQTANIPVFMKESLREIMGSDFIQEYPPELKRVHLSMKMERKLYARCCLCTMTYKKSEMITLLGRTGRGEQPKQYGWMCKRCFKNFCTDNGLDVPDLNGLKEK